MRKRERESKREEIFKGMMGASGPFSYLVKKAGTLLYVNAIVLVNISGFI